jgi:transcriptional regulator with XRE-family HTH domain
MQSLRTDLGQAMRERRIAIGVSQERLGEFCALDRTYISGIERGVRNPTIDSLSRIAEALECNLSELICSAESIRESRSKKSSTQGKSVSRKRK